MTTQKIITKDGNFRVKCPKIDTFVDAHKCKKCSKFIAIDPVKAEIKCKEIKY